MSLTCVITWAGGGGVFCCGLTEKADLQFPGEQLLHLLK